jgi:hypothetical protein
MPPPGASRPLFLSGCFLSINENIPQKMWVHLDSNQGPTGYEPDALTAELWTQEEALAGAVGQYIAVGHCAGGGS